MFLNSAPVYCLSKKQASIELHSFGLEFITMKQCCKYLHGLHYKLQMMGIPCNGLMYIFGDNKSVLCNMLIPELGLSKKFQSIAYHFVFNGAACNEWRMAYVSTHNNEADLLTKVLPSGEKRKGFMQNLLHHIFH